MAVIKSPTLFFVTSPRSPAKMRPEIKLLIHEFAGLRWNKNTGLQTAFMQRLTQLPEFEGAVNPNNPALSARDRITRGPKALGLVALDPIALTAAGKNFLDEDLSEEALLRQLLKFQLPSPFHRENSRLGVRFCIRPYLEMLRLISTLGGLTFDELWLFGMQLTDYHEFDAIVKEVKNFRLEKERRRTHYKAFLRQTRREVIERVFAREIKAGKIKTRESTTACLDKFVKTKAGNLRDYADACLRYLRAAGLVTISSSGRTITIIESRRRDVAFILDHVDRNPVFMTDESAYRTHLFDAATPVLLGDDKRMLEAQAIEICAVRTEGEATALDAPTLKKKIKRAEEYRRKSILQAQIAELKSFDKYDDVLKVFSAIRRKEVFDPPLVLEWNVWRAMTMLDGGNISANLHFDNDGNPLSTAPGKVSDIVCDYGDFVVSVEVTLQRGCRQYDTEAEPVARHLGDLKAQTNKVAFCLFVAPEINESSISHFFMLHRTNVRHYGGKSVVIPLSLDRFVGMLVQAKKHGTIPSSSKIRALCEYSKQAADMAEDEMDWYSRISAKVDNWLQ